MAPISSSRAGIEPIFVSVAEAADALAVSRWQIYELLNKQQIESRYQGRKRLVVVSSLREYAQGLKAYPEPTADAS